MSEKVHIFGESLAIGLAYEEILDKFYGQGYTINHVGYSLQLLGIDRIWLHRKSRKRYSVEYKSDIKAGETDNIFIETLSNEVTGQLGWAYTSCAQLLITFIPAKDYAYRATMIAVKYHLDEWIKKYPSIEVKNDGYISRGVLLPMYIFEEVAFYKDTHIVEKLKKVGLIKEKDEDSSKHDDLQREAISKGSDTSTTSLR